MRMIELAAQYRETAAELKARIARLSLALDSDEIGETEKFKLRGRIDALRSMYYDVNEAACVMEHYYDRRHKRNGRYCV